MAIEPKEEVCEACGCLAEVGTIIREGDDVVTVPVEGSDEADARARQARYLEIAKMACPDVKMQDELTQVGSGVVLNTVFEFTCTAEKMIFELRARSVR